MCLIPISDRRDMKAGVPAFISTNGGQTFALGQCPMRSMMYEHPTSTGASAGARRT